MRNLILPIFLIMTLAACSSQGPRPDPGVGVAQARIAPSEPLSQGDEAAGDLMYQLLVGEIAGQLGALDISVDHYLQAARSSADPAVAERAARVSLFADRRPQALEASRRWVELAPESLEARQVLGALLVNAGEVPEALEHLEWVVAHTPQGEAAGYGTVSNLLSRSQNREAALAAMQGLAERNTQAPGMQLALARLALQLQQPEVAIGAADRTLALDPSFSEAHVLRARGLVQAGELERGLQGLRQAVAASPDDSELRMAFGRLLIQAESYDEARAEFERLIEQRPGDADLLYTLGLLSIEVERYEDARSYLTRLLETGRRSNDANYYLGRIAET
ncbi:MAG: tetratricopeptide repeat protein, partial [Thioalkalivibrio sp.]